MKKFANHALCVIAGAAAALLLCRLWVPEQKKALPDDVQQPPPQQQQEKKSAEEAQAPRVLTGYGYIRGRSCTTLKNKYGAYVSKVHYYSDTPVKKGDCILEYDDFDLRQKIVSVENSITSLEKELALQRTKLELTRLDPLPSDYRNISWKTRRARELYERAAKEWEVYKRLYDTKSVSELEMRAKKQAFEDAHAAWEIAVSDQKKVSKGLKELTIRQAEQNMALLETKLADRIVTAPYDGIIVTDSDTVHAWDNAGTAAAYIHRVHKGYYIYSYFEEKDIIHLPNGTKGKFFSNDTGKYYDLVSFDTTRTRTAVGDKVFHLVKFRVLSPVDKKVTMNGAGVVLVTLPGK